MTKALRDRVRAVPRTKLADLAEGTTARAVVEPMDAEVDLANEAHYEPHRYPSPRELAFLAARLVMHAADRKLAYRESIIGIDELITVVGAGIREGDPLAPPPADYRSEPPTRLRFVGSRDQQLLISGAEDVVLAP